MTTAERLQKFALSKNHLRNKWILVAAGCWFLPFILLLMFRAVSTLAFQATFLLMPFFMMIGSFFWAGVAAIFWFYPYDTDETIQQGRPSWNLPAPVRSFLFWYKVLFLILWVSFAVFLWLYATAGIYADYSS